jgi:integrase
MEIGCVNISIRRSYLMGTIFHLKKEGKPDKDGNPRGCWRYEDKQHGIRDTFNESFAHEMKRLREGGVSLPIKDLVDQLLDLKNSNSLKSGLTVSEYAERYIADKVADYKDKDNRSERKLRKHEWRQRHYLSHFVKMFEKRRLADITVEDIKTFYRSRRSYIRKTKTGEKPLQKDTVVLEVIHVGSMFIHAIRFGKFVGANPVRQAGITKEDRRRNRVLTMEEQSRLLAVCSRDLKHLVILLLNTGCRVGEILSSKWAWINLDTRIMHLPDYATKTEEERDVRLNHVSLAILRERSLLTKGSLFVFPSLSRDSEIGHRTWMYGAWYTALKRAGISDLNFHDLRHTFGTRLKELKTDSSAVQAAIGHKDYRSTTRYIHVEDSVMGSVDLLGFTYFGAKTEEKSA